MDNPIVALSVFGAAMLTLGAALSSCERTKPVETFTLVQNCDGPFMRRTRESIQRRDSDGKLFYKDAQDRLQALEDNPQLKKICR